MKRRNLFWWACLMGGLGACGGSGTRTATTTSTTGGGGTVAAESGAVASGDEEADAPCTSWDPSADPRTAPADVAAPPPGARRGLNGLRFCVLRRGTGTRRPTTNVQVVVHYAGWTTDGQLFDSSHGRGEPSTFPVTGVIRGWTESLTHMTVGQVRRVWIPEELAYGGQAGRPAGMLVFDMELIGIAE